MSDDEQRHHERRDDTRRDDEHGHHKRRKTERRNNERENDERRDDTHGDEKLERNEKVLHTRISPSLDREIKRRARGLGMSVSTVVRNVLLHTFDLVEDIVNDSTNVALSIAGDHEEKPTGGDEPLPRTTRRTRRPVRDTPGREYIIGWQELILNLNAVCDRCNTILAKGARAAVGISEASEPHTVICSDCLEAITADGGDGGENDRPGNRPGNDSPKQRGPGR